MDDKPMSLAERLRTVAKCIEVAERGGFMDNDLRDSVIFALKEITSEIQQPLINQVVDEVIAEEPISRREKKALHRLRAKLALVAKPEERTQQ